jgi:hypothetical protein
MGQQQFLKCVEYAVPTPTFQWLKVNLKSISLLDISLCKSKHFVGMEMSFLGLISFCRLVTRHSWILTLRNYRWKRHLCLPFEQRSTRKFQIFRRQFCGRVSNANDYYKRCRHFGSRTHHCDRHEHQILSRQGIRLINQFFITEAVINRCTVPF